MNSQPKPHKPDRTEDRTEPGKSNLLLFNGAIEPTSLHKTKNPETEVEIDIDSKRTENRENFENRKNVENYGNFENYENFKSVVSYGKLYVADHVISLLVVGPLNVMFWQGLWDLLGLSVFPDSSMHTAIFCSVIGNVGLLAMFLSQTILTSGLHHSNTLDWLLGYHIHTYMLGFFNVTQWKGTWDLLDLLTGKSSTSAWATCLIGLLCLSVSRTLSNARGPPVQINVDIESTAFEQTTRFRTKPGVTIKHLADCSFTVFFIHNLVVVYWRGTWELIDIYLYPDHLSYSATLTVIGSLVLHLTTCCLELTLNALNNKLKGNYTRCSWGFILVIRHMAIILTTLVGITFWRGLWILMQIYLTFSWVKLGYLLTHLIGVGVLMMMLCGQSVTIKGCALDYQVGGPGKIMEIPNQYLRYFVKVRHT